MKNYGVNFANATIYSLLWLLLLFPFLVVTNLLSNQQKQNGLGKLGFWMLAIVYLFQIIGSIFSSAAVAKFGLVRIQWIGGILLSTICIGSIFSAWKASLRYTPETDLNFMQAAFTNTNFVVTVMFLTSALAGLG
jgi:hypothetical protein